MKVTVELTVDRLGVPMRSAAHIVSKYLPEYITHNGYSVHINDAKVLSVNVEDERDTLTPSLHEA